MATRASQDALLEPHKGYRAAKLPLLRASLHASLMGQQATSLESEPEAGMGTLRGYDQLSLVNASSLFSGVACGLVPVRRHGGIAMALCIPVRYRHGPRNGKVCAFSLALLRFWKGKCGATVYASPLQHAV